MVQQPHSGRDGSAGEDRPAGTAGSILRIVIGAFVIFAGGLLFFYLQAPGPRTTPTTTTSSERPTDPNMTLKQPGN